MTVRRDPVPEWAPPPDVLHVVVVNGVPVDYGGRTASILAKCRTLYQQGGVESVLLVRGFAPSLPRAVEAMATRGHLSPGIRVMGVREAYPDHTEPGPPDPRATQSLTQMEDEGWHAVGGTSGGAPPPRELARCEHGVRRARRGFEQGRLAFEERFDVSGSRVERDDFDPDGRLLATTYWQDSAETPCRRVLFRRNGAAMYAHGTRPPARPGGWPRESGTTTFDDLGRPEAEHETFEPVLHRALDAVIGGRPAVVSVEDRQVDREVMAYQRAHVRRCHVLHSTHLEPPGDDLGAVRRGFKRVLRHTDDTSAVVFLTDTQRAEAEAHLGHHANFHVIPHAAPESSLDPTVRRDPDLVLIMGRLAPQKRLDHAIRAFAEVRRSTPRARLEIFGGGPLKDDLERLVDRLGMRESVTFRGYTNDPGREYQRAALCLLSSTFEGAPMVIVEALRHGCPVVSYDIRYGPADIIEDGVNGFLVRDGDVGALAARVRQVLEDPVLAQRLQDGCARAEERFGQRALAARWFELFRQMPTTTTAPAPQEVGQ